MSSAAEDFLEMYRCPTPTELGEIGEHITARTLQDDLSLKVVRHIYLPVDYKFTEIDMIAISSYGLFVIENKNYKGWVRGSRSSYYWDVIYDSYRIESLFNPIKQNEKHINVLGQLLNGTIYECVPRTNIVIFNNYCSLNLKDCDNTVFKLKRFTEYYGGITEDSILSDSDIEELYNILSVFSDTSDDMRAIHVSLLT